MSKQIFYICIVILIASSQAFVCTTGDCSTNSISREQWLISGCSSIAAYSIIQGPLSQDFYIHGNCECSGVNVAITIRITEAGSITFTVGYSGHSMIRTFAMKNDESQLYFCISSSTQVFEFLALSCADGNNVHRIYSSTTSNTSNQNSLSILNQANTVMYFGVQNNSSTKGSVCRKELSNSILNCIEFTGIANIRSLAYINEYELFYASFELAGARRLFMQRINFSNNSTVWTQTYLCVGTGSCILGMSASISNSDSSLIYAFNSYGISGLQYPQFLVLNSTTGVAVTAIYTFPFTCSDIYKMKISNSKIYSLASCYSRTFIIIYNTISDSFEYYSAYANPNIDLFGFTFEKNTGRCANLIFWIAQGQNY